MMAWLRGEDLNLRPLGYESNHIVARPFCSISYGDGGPWFLPLFGRFCGRSVVKKSAQRLPKDGTRILRQPESISRFGILIHHPIALAEPPQKNRQAFKGSACSPWLGKT